MNIIAWTHKELTTYDEAVEVLQLYKSRLKAGCVLASAFDTETTGLHPVLDVPFLYQCGWLEGSIGYVIIVDIEDNRNVAEYFIRNWNNLTEHAPIYLGHHAIFDQHMTENIGLRYKHWDNLTDTQFYIRASSNAVQVDKGGESLALKDWAVKHISIDANKYEKNLAKLRSELATKYNNELKDRLHCTKKVLDEFFKDKTNDISEKSEWASIYNEWYSALPERLRLNVSGLIERDDVPYSIIDREAVKEYSYYDIEYTLTCWALCDPVVKVRDNYELIRRETIAMRDFYEMERVGFLVDVDYIRESKQRLKEYILRRRRDLCLLAGTDLKSSQAKKIQQILLSKYGISTDSVDSKAMEKIKVNIRRDYPDAEVIEFVETIQELRTLEKWYSTYICGFETQLRRSDRIYTSINQVGAVSGRISCNFQQFPKEGIRDLDGNELYDPRRMVLVDKDSGYDSIFYLD